MCYIILQLTEIKKIGESPVEVLSNEIFAIHNLNVEGVSEV